MQRTPDTDHPESAVTTDTTARPTTDRPPTPLEHRRVKARAIALHLWRHGLTVDDILGLPYASRIRQARTMSRFAREAFAASPRPEARTKDPPDGRTSRTWLITREKLAEIEAMARRGEPVPERDLIGDRDAWLPPPVDAPTEPAPQLPPPPRAATDVAPTPAVKPSARAVAPAAVLDAVLGPKCPGCGWRQRGAGGGLHRPAVVGWLPACPTTEGAR